MKATQILLVPLAAGLLEGNYTDGKPVRVIAYTIPDKNPEKPESWTPEVLSEELDVCHNFWPRPSPVPGNPPEILVTAYEGVFTIHKTRSG